MHFKRGCGFTMIANEFIEGSHALTDKAFRILVFMISKPHTWKFRRSHLMKSLGMGDAKLRAGLKELREDGFLETVNLRGQGGQISDRYLRLTPMALGEMGYEVIDDDGNPAPPPSCGKPTTRRQDVGSPSCGKPTMRLSHEPSKTETESNTEGVSPNGDTQGSGGVGEKPNPRKRAPSVRPAVTAIFDLWSALYQKRFHEPYVVTNHAATFSMLTKTVKSMQKQGLLPEKVIKDRMIRLFQPGNESAEWMEEKGQFTLRAFLSEGIFSRLADLPRAGKTPAADILGVKLESRKGRR